MTGLPEYFAHARYNIAPGDVTQLMLSCQPEDIQERVVITPCWELDSFLPDDAKVVRSFTERSLAACVYTLSYKNQLITVIRSGIGAPQAGEVVLALGGTPCRRLVFTGSFGALTEELKIGDLLTITESIGGDGFSSYLPEGKLAPHAFLQPARPDAALSQRLTQHAQRLADASGVTLHRGRVFCSDTILAQYFHLDEMAADHGCAGVEMETSAVFNCARLAGISATALLLVSDVLPALKTLFSGRSEAEMQRYHSVRKDVLGRIILDTLGDEDREG